MLKHLMLTTLLAAGLVGPAFAQSGMDNDSDARPRRGARQDRMAMAEKLNLSEKQQSQMDKLRIDKQKKQVALQGKIRLLRVEIQELYLPENPDRNAIEKKMKEVSDLQHQAKVAALDHMFAVRTILTPEQQKLWKQHVRKTGPGKHQGMMMGGEGRMMQRQGGIMNRGGRTIEREVRIMKDVDPQ